MKQLNWDLYKSKKTKLSKAIALTFYMIGSADGEVSPEEINKMEELVKSTDIYHQLGGHEFDLDLADAKDLFLTNAESALTTTKHTLKSFHGDEEAIDFLLTLAQNFIIADQVLHDREEVAMRELCKYLGRPEIIK